MEPHQRLLARLEAIGQALEQTGNALALIGLGSVGIELNRLDQYSDLDFFAVVKPGYKATFLHDLSWLSSICPVAFSFQNTRDGHKLLFEDDIFCEFAVFEEAELATIPFAEGRLVWKAPEVDDAIRTPVCTSGRRETMSVEWLLGEALTCLYIGLKRHHRGEKLSAQRFIQNYAVDHTLALAMTLETAMPAAPDPFTLERRYEQRFPQAARRLPDFVQGYAFNCESALAVLDFLQERFPVNPALGARIRELCSAG